MIELFQIVLIFVIGFIIGKLVFRWGIKPLLGPVWFTHTYYGKRLKVMQKRNESNQQVKDRLNKKKLDCEYRYELKKVKQEG